MQNRPRGSGETSQNLHLDVLIVDWIKTYFRHREEILENFY